jgi:hypothetical protein
MRFRGLACVLGLSAGSLLLPGATLAQTAHPTFVTQMNGFEEVPGAATLASGFAGIQVGTDGNTVYYTITVTDTSSQLVAAHLHWAPVGVAGPIVVTLCSAQTKPCQTEGVVAQGTFTAADFTGPFENDSLDRLINESRNGMVYANVHSTKFGTGEARGQLADLGAMMHMMEPTMPMNDTNMNTGH